jgi:thioredoxin-dependent peroxiredoxin
MLNVGDRAPDFELPDDEGKPVKLSDFRGKKVVLYFYPADFTSGCELQACKFRDGYPQIEEKNATVIGVSPDSVDSHRRFREAHNLPFHLLVDKDFRVASLYNSVKSKADESGNTIRSIQRGQYVIDEDGVITDVQTPVQAPVSLRLALQALGVAGEAE